MDVGAVLEGTCSCDDDRETTAKRTRNNLTGPKIVVAVSVSAVDLL